MPWTDDPIADFHRHDRQSENALDKLPRCSICDKPIQEDHFYEINGDYICLECLEDFERDTDDYVKEI